MTPRELYAIGCPRGPELRDRLAGKPTEQMIASQRRRRRSRALRPDVWRIVVGDLEQLELGSVDVVTRRRSIRRRPFGARDAYATPVVAVIDVVSAIFGCRIDHARHEVS